MSQQRKNSSSDDTSEASEVAERSGQSRVQQRAERYEVAGRLAGAVAHDFNNLLSIVLNHAELVRADGGLTEQQIDDLQTIEDAAIQASDLTRKLLLFGRQDMAKPSFVSVAESLRRALETFDTPPDGRLELVVEIDESTVIWVHEKQWNESLGHLLSNAAEAVETGGNISVRASIVELAAEHDAGLPAGSYVQVSVTDTGAGMEAEVAERAFEPFYTTKPTVGTGLGLSIVYGMATTFGGHADLETAPGRGTTVTMLLPKHTNDEPSDDEKGDGVDEQTAPGATILVVEDEPGVLRAVQRILSAHGYNLLTATSGPDALAVLAETDQNVDLLLTDVVMPGMSGVQLAKKVMRQDESIRVLYMSGYTESALSLDQLVAGKSDLILKPFTATDLLEVIKIHLTH